MTDRKDPQYAIGFGDGLAVAMAIFSAVMGIGLLVRAFYD